MTKFGTVLFVFVCAIAFSESEVLTVRESKDSMVEYLGKPDMVELSGLSLPVYKEARIKVGPYKDTKVYLTGWGTYSRLIFFPRRVYFAVSYTAKETGISKEDPMKSIGESEVEVMRLTMFMDVNKTQAKRHFEQGLLANDIDADREDIQDLLNEIPDTARKDVTTLIAIGPQKSEKLWMEYPEEVVESNWAENRAFDLWNTWFGKPLDTYMEQLKKDLIGTPARD